MQEIKSFANGFVKGVVDLDKELVAPDADMHYELADYLKEKQGSNGFARGGMGILDMDIMEKATEVICKWIQF